MSDARVPPARRRSLAALALLLATTSCMTAGGPAQLADAVDLGRGEKGELCRAERLWGDAAAPGDFDRAYNLRCRGWTDTQLAGRLHALDARPDTAARLEASRAARMLCGDPVSVDIKGLGPAQAHRCIEREAGFPALAVELRRGGKVFAVDGLDRFNGNIEAGLRFIAGTGRSPDAATVPAGRLALGAAAVPATAIGASDFVDEGALNGRRREVIDYSVRGENVEAREIVTRYTARLPANASPANRVGFLLESALSESNLGYPDVAASYLDRAETTLANSESLIGPAGGFLRAKLRVYRAMDALNRRDFAAAIATAGAGAEAAAQLTGIGATTAADAAELANPLGNPAVVRDLNARGTDAQLRSASLRPEILRAQALYVRGAAQRATGAVGEAEAALAAANAALDRVEQSGGVETSSLQWIRSQIAVERARAAIARKDSVAAGTFYAESVSRIEGVSTYAGSPLLAQRKLAYAAFLADNNDRGGAAQQYADALQVMRAGGPSAASSGAGLEGYFAILQQDSAGAGDAATAAQAQFFIASQLVNPPEVAAQIAQIQKIFESGSSEAAVRAKTLQDLDRESRGLATQIATLAEDSKDRAKLQAALDVNAARVLQVRRELAGDQQYLQASDSVVSLAELQAALRPGEAYVKLLTLPRQSYSIVVTKTATRIFPVGVSSAALVTLVRKVRASIDGNIARDGRVVPLVFDVNAAFDLHNALLGPAAALLAETRTLITEPTGPMTQLPFGVLVGDKASTDWFAENVKKNSRDYSQVRFLAGRFDLDTTVSPRAFLVARSLPASQAKFPYIGFGNHAQPSAAALTSLPDRGALAGRCAARADALRAGFASMKSIGAKELATASSLSGTGSDLVQGDAFTDSALDAKKDYRAYAVVHFATHGLKQGELDCDSPPALITSIGDDASSDGLLSFEEIANLQFDANLVVLSACNTAAETRASRASGTTGFRAGRAGQGATLNGLVRAFLVAGSRTVVTTHWAIPDGFRTRDGRQVAASTQLMETFFQQGATNSIASSMRSAQSKMITAPDTSHPYYWGAFAIVGDGEKLMFARAPVSGTAVASVTGK